MANRTNQLYEMTYFQDQVKKAMSADIVTPMIIEETVGVAILFENGPVLFHYDEIGTHFFKRNHKDPVQALIDLYEYSLTQG